MARKRRLNTAGFTIVEFMIATAVFSAILLVCSFAIIYVGRLYFKGSLMSRTQDASRRVGEDVTQAIQFGAGSSGTNFIRPNAVVSADPDIKAWCIGGIRYSYAVDRSLNSSSHVLWKNRVQADDTVCTPCDLTQTTPCGDGEELLGNRMRVPTFAITPSATSNLNDINIIISYGDLGGEFVTGSNFSICKGINASGDFCAVAAYRTNVARRL